MVHAEISIYPMGTQSTSASFYIAKSIEAIRGLEGVRHEITPMGTLLEARTLGEIFEAADMMCEAVHNLGVGRVEVVLKVDSRRDKAQSMDDKMGSVKKHLGQDI
ncbi:conserved hypothetical protein [Cenarchaeum symbiosum A]|uniref:Thiamine-binding protein domain-containing protein n=1 Tax=Cenarchaeum symbiosum (strain A) TaxID=414004 RepID=A0RYL1_CENSY|nr:conserved hypothetical protein [Cenarchaeum symbiosum A]